MSSCKSRLLHCVDCPKPDGPFTTIVQSLCAFGRAAAFGKTCSGSLPARDARHTRKTINSTHIKAHRSAARGREKGGRLSVAHAAGATRRWMPAHAKGRLIAILLTGGEAHDYPVVERLMRRVKPRGHTLGDMAYDGNGWREKLHERGTRPSFQTDPPGSSCSASTSVLQAALAHRGRIEPTEGFETDCYPLRQARAELSRLCLPRCRSRTVDQ